MRKKLFGAAIAAMLVAVAAVLCACGPVQKKGEVAKVSQISVGDKQISSFRVLQLNDLHLTKGSSLKKDKETLRWVGEAIDYSNPDLVVVAGDAVGGAYGRNTAMIELANLLEEKKVYWAYTFGNHDGEWSEETKTQLDPSDITGRLELYEILKGYKYSLMKYEAEKVTLTGENGAQIEQTLDGVGNYCIDLISEGTATPERLFTFVFMDSGGKYYDAAGEDKGYRGLTANQVQWYKNQMDARKDDAGKYPASALFMHVPPTEFQTAWEDTANPFIGSFPLINNESRCYAQNAEFNTGIFEAVKAAGTSLIACAHDHNFNWMKNHEGVLFSYGRCSGVNAWERTAPVGATIYDINLNAEYTVGGQVPEGASYTNGLYTVSVIEPEFEYSSYFH